MATSRVNNNYNRNVVNVKMFTYGGKVCMETLTEDGHTYYLNLSPEEACTIGSKLTKHGGYVPANPTKIEG